MGLALFLVQVIGEPQPGGRRHVSDHAPQLPHPQLDPDV